MRIAWWRLGLISLIVSAGCGGAATKGGSGLDPSRLVASLTGDELQTLCQWSADTEGGSGKVTSCQVDGGMSNASVKPPSSCAADFMKRSCQLTVGQVEDCSRAVGADPCHALSAMPCVPILACAFSA
jgi:hypothetical protein